MQAQKEVLAKIVSITLLIKSFPLLLPSHNCINKLQCSVFKVHLWASFSRDSMKQLNRLNCFSQSLNFAFCILHLKEVVGQNGLAFLRKSHAGWNSPQDCFQEPAFESLIELCHPTLQLPFKLSEKWWAKMDSNHRPHDYQSCALASWAIGPFPFAHFFGGD